MKKINVVILALFSVVSTGCATIVKDANQPIKVETYANGGMVEGAKCTAKNSRGETATTTPGPVIVRRSGDNLSINCEKDGVSGFATLISRANGGMFGNILFGGGIGAIIDHNKGTAYSYPDWVRVMLGENLMYDRKNNIDSEVMLGQPVSAEELKKIEDAKVTEVKASEDVAKKEAAAKAGQ